MKKTPLLSLSGRFFCPLFSKIDENRKKVCICNFFLYICSVCSFFIVKILENV